MRRIFKGPQNSTCYIERIFKGPQNSRLHRLWTALLPHRTHLQCAKRPRSEVSRHNKRDL